MNKRKMMLKLQSRMAKYRYEQHEIISELNNLISWYESNQKADTKQLLRYKYYLNSTLQIAGDENDKQYIDIRGLFMEITNHFLNETNHAKK